ncbi:hypothetical protein COO60DRAFT_1634833 [Scenedesmus sp. NREL 46B-D3]|nr:hypothetical protein COO60DRAFT_1634833 [Scenedesmus sp. NREL 46B-D3]
MTSTDVGIDHGTLYHLVQQDIWQQCKDSAHAYFPPTYEADGFIHLTKEAQLLLGVANHFYTQVPGTFLVLAIDSAKLSSKQVVFEAAAPVGDQRPLEGQQLFPHLFGTIDFAAVCAELPVERAADGTFLAIPGLPAQ